MVLTGYLLCKLCGASNVAVSKGLLKKITSFSFIAVTHLLMDIIPKLTQLSLFFQKEDLDLAMLRPSVDSVVQQLTWLKTNDGHFLSEFMSVSANGTLSEYKVVKVVDTPILRQQFEKVRREFLSKVISEINRLRKRFPAEATDLVSKMAMLCLRGLSLLSDEGRKKFGQSQMEALVAHYGSARGDPPAIVDSKAAWQEWDMCKEVVYQQQHHCHTIHSTWKLLSVQHPGSFPNLAKLAMIAALALLKTATVERGFSVQNEIKVASRNRLYLYHGLC